MDPLVIVENQPVTILSPRHHLLFQEVTTQHKKFFIASYGSYRKFLTPGECARLSEKLLLVFDPILTEPLYFLRELVIKEAKCFIEYHSDQTDICFNDDRLEGDILILNNCYVDGKELCFTGHDPLLTEKFDKIFLDFQWIIENIYCLDNIEEPKWLQLNIKDFQNLMGYFEMNPMIKSD